MANKSWHWQSRRPWREALVRPIVPDNEGPTTPLSVRLPAKLRERIRRIADATGNDLSTTLLHLVRWGCEETERQQMLERERAAKKP